MTEKNGIIVKSYRLVEVCTKFICEDNTYPPVDAIKAQRKCVKDCGNYKCNMRHPKLCPYHSFAKIPEDEFVSTGEIIPVKWLEQKKLDEFDL